MHVNASQADIFYKFLGMENVTHTISVEDFFGENMFITTDFLEAKNMLEEFQKRYENDESFKVFHDQLAQEIEGIHSLGPKKMINQLYKSHGQKEPYQV